MARVVGALQMRTRRPRSRFCYSLQRQQLLATRGNFKILVVRLVAKSVRFNVAGFGFNQLLLPNSLLDNGWPVDGFCLLVFWDPLVGMQSPRGFFLDATLSCIDHRPSARQ